MLSRLSPDPVHTEDISEESFSSKTEYIHSCREYSGWPSSDIVQLCSLHAGHFADMRKHTRNRPCDGLVHLCSPVPANRQCPHGPVLLHDLVRLPSKSSHSLFLCPSRTHNPNTKRPACTWLPVFPDGQRL